MADLLTQRRLVEPDGRLRRGLRTPTRRLVVLRPVALLGVVLALLGLVRLLRLLGVGLLRVVRRLGLAGVGLLLLRGGLRLAVLGLALGVSGLRLSVLGLALLRGAEQVLVRSGRCSVVGDPQVGLGARA